MQIKLKKLQLLNFKGCKDLTLLFGSLTDISGANATGKTRIFDAFTWLFFGKDSEDKKDFNIKTLDPTGEAIHRHDSGVVGLLEIDGMNKEFSRVYAEKWQKKRGSEEAEFTGHETLYYVDGVPMLQKEYIEAVNAITTEELFKLLTNPFHFSSMRWDQRREILIRMANVSEQEILQSTPEFKRLLEAMEGKPLVSFLKMISERKKKLKADLLGIPPRIDEVRKGMPEAQNWAELEAWITEREAETLELDKKIKSKISRYESKHKEGLAIQQEVLGLRLKLDKLYGESTLNQTKKIEETKYLISLAKEQMKHQESNIKFHQENIKAKERSIALMEKDIIKMREEWEETNKTEISFSDGYDFCPTCKQKLPEEDIQTKHDQLTKFFNQEKSSKLQRITKQGEGVAQNIQSEKAKITEAKGLIERLSKEIKDLNERVRDLEIQLTAEEEVVAPEPADAILIKKQIQDLEAKDEKISMPDTQDLKDQIKTLKGMIDHKKLQLAQKALIDSSFERINQLMDQEKDLSQQLADLEKMGFIADSFEKTRIEAVEEQINSRFSLVRFKMFNQLINGGSEPACEILINGIPFPDVNNAAKINAGIDIINALSAYYMITAPIFVDNAEAVNEIISTPSQLIRLVVTKDPELITKIILS